MKRILIVEDDRALSGGIALALQDGGLTLHQFCDLASAREALASEAFDLLILDINLPDGSGLDLLRELRKGRSLPVILLTANDLETDIVTGLELGADDYITKPFSLAVLRARVNTQLRKQAENSASRFEQDGLCLDFSRLEFMKDGVPLELSKTEQKLLKLLIENRGLTLERGLLIDRIWTDGADFVDENALSVSIKRLRDKLGGGAANIKTIYGIGYTWAVK